MKGSKEPTGHFVATANKILPAEHRRSLLSLEKKKKKCLVLRWFRLENHQKACSFSLSFFFFFFFLHNSFYLHFKTFSGPPVCMYQECSNPPGQKPEWRWECQSHQWSFWPGNRHERSTLKHTPLLLPELPLTTKAKWSIFLITRTRYLATQKTAVSEFPEEESKEESAYHEDQRQKRGVGLVNDVFNVSPSRRGRVFWHERVLLKHLEIRRKRFSL